MVSLCSGRSSAAFFAWIPQGSYEQPTLNGARFGGHRFTFGANPHKKKQLRKVAGKALGSGKAKYVPSICVRRRMPLSPTSCQESWYSLARPGVRPRHPESLIRQRGAWRPVHAPRAGETGMTAAVGSALCRYDRVCVHRIRLDA